MNKNLKNHYVELTQCLEDYLFTPLNQIDMREKHSNYIILDIKKNNFIKQNFGSDIENLYHESIEMKRRADRGNRVKFPNIPLLSIINIPNWRALTSNDLRVLETAYYFLAYDGNLIQVSKFLNREINKAYTDLMDNRLRELLKPETYSLLQHYLKFSCLFNDNAIVNSSIIKNTIFESFFRNFGDLWQTAIETQIPVRIILFVLESNYAKVKLKNQIPYIEERKKEQTNILEMMSKFEWKIIYERKDIKECAAEFFLLESQIQSEIEKLSRVHPLKGKLIQECLKQIELEKGQKMQKSILQTIES